MNTYEVGDGVRLSNDFRDTAGALADPTTITLKVQDPSGTTTSYGSGQWTKDATGQYHKDITANAAGTWHWRWEGTGAVVAVSEGSFYVRRSAFS